MTALAVHSPFGPALGVLRTKKGSVMTQVQRIESETPVVNTMPGHLPAPHQVPRSQKHFLVRALIDWRDALVYAVRSRKLTEREMDRLHRDAVNDPEVELAMQKTVAAHPQFRRKASTGGGVQGQPKQ